MNVKIIETGKIIELTILDERGIDYSQDLIGNAGAFSDGQFEIDPDEGRYIASEDTVEWWQQYINDTIKIEREVGEMAQKYGLDRAEIFERISCDQGEDYNDHYNQARHVIDEINDEQAQIRSKAAAALGKIGGASRSEAKQTASRINGTKGGRPKKS